MQSRVARCHELQHEVGKLRDAPFASCLLHHGGDVDLDEFHGGHLHRSRAVCHGCDDLRDLIERLGRILAHHVQGIEAKLLFRFPGLFKVDELTFGQLHARLVALADVKDPDAAAGGKNRRDDLLRQHRLARARSARHHGVVVAVAVGKNIDGHEFSAAGHEHQHGLAFHFRCSCRTASKLPHHRQHVSCRLARDRVGPPCRLDVAHQAHARFQRKTLHQIHHLQPQVDLRLETRRGEDIGGVVRGGNAFARRRIHDHGLRDAREPPAVFAGLLCDLEIPSALGEVRQKMPDLGVDELPHAGVFHGNHGTVLRECRRLDARRPQEGRVDARSGCGCRSEHDSQSRQMRVSRQPGHGQSDGFDGVFPSVGLGRRRRKHNPVAGDIDRGVGKDRRGSENVGSHAGFVVGPCLGAMSR